MPCCAVLCCDAPWQLGRTAFGDALFELADIWTRGVSAAEYAAFLWELCAHPSPSPLTPHPRPQPPPQGLITSRVLACVRTVCRLLLSSGVFSGISWYLLASPLAQPRRSDGTHRDCDALAAG
jgi:hypothetical protein